MIQLSLSELLSLLKWFCGVLDELVMSQKGLIHQCVFFMRAMVSK